MRLGIIDAGTNTFHLCIIELNKEYGYTQIKKEKCVCKFSSKWIRLY